MKNLRSAIILCGGKGTRLGAISKKFQKLLSKYIKKKFCGILLSFYSKISLIILFFRWDIKVIK